MITRQRGKLGDSINTHLSIYVSLLDIIVEF